MVMILTGQTSIRDVILFPLLRPQPGDDDETPEVAPERKLNNSLHLITQGKPGHPGFPFFYPSRESLPITPCKTLISIVLVQP